MSATPRTDTHIRANTGNGTQYVSADFARLLERELNEAKAVNMGLCGLSTEETYHKVSEAKALRRHIDEMQKLLPNDSTIQQGIRRLQDALTQQALLLTAMQRVINELYLDTEGYADGAPDASAHDKLCNQISSALHPFFKP